MFLANFAPLSCHSHQEFGADELAATTRDRALLVLVFE